MLLIGFLVLAVVLAAVPAYFSICRKCNPERIVLMTLLTNVLLYYLCCACHFVESGLVLILAANLGFCVPVIRRLFRESAAWKRFFTPAMLIYFAMFPVFYLATFYMKFCQWDEFSHWGFANSLLFRHNMLNCGFSQYLEHASYLPGVPLIYVFIHKCISRNFSEPLIYFANLLTIFTIFLSFVSDRKERGNVPSKLCGMLGGGLLLFLFVDDWLYSIYSEPLLVILGALILSRVFTSENRVSDDLELMILLMAMVLVKTSAMGTIVFALVFYLIRVWKYRACRKTKWEKVLPLLVCAMPFLVKVSWSLLLKIHRTHIIFPVKVPFGEAVRTLCADSYTGQVAWAMCRKFCTTGTLWGSLLVLVAVAVWHCLKGKNKPAEWKMIYFVFMPLFFLTMMFSLLVTYLFVFTPFQAAKLVSFERYTLTFLGILMFVQLFLLLREKQLHNSGNLWFKIARSAVICVCFGCAVIILVKRQFRIDVRWRREADAMQRSYASCFEGGEKFTVLTREGNGMKNFIYRYLFPDNFAPVEWFDPVLPNGEQALYQTALSPEELLKKLRGTAEYVLLESMDGRFFKDYKTIFADGEAGFRQQALYRITPDGLKYCPSKK